MVQQRVHRFLAAMNQVQHAGGQAGFVQQFDDARGRERNFFGRLQHEGVAAGDGERIHPHRHHGREIERRDARAHADRLANRSCSRCPAATSFSESPIIRLGMPQATSTIWMARRTSTLASSAVLPFSRVRMAATSVGVLFEQRLEAVEHLHAIHHRHVAPLQKRLVRGCGRRGPRPPRSA